MLTIPSIKKTSLFFSLFLMLMLSITSCGRREVDSKEVAQELNEPNSDATKESDEKFLVNTADMNYREIMLGKLAQQRAISADVKALAKVLEDAHQRAISEISALASTKAIAVPTAASKAVMDDYEKLSQKDAKEFDKEYCNMIISNHKDLINKYESYTNGKCDQDVKVWVLGIISEERIHLAKAQDMETQVKNSVSLN
jgi:putative membrane protein